MIDRWFVAHGGLIQAARFPPLTRSREHVSAGELFALLMCGGVAATAVGVVKLGLRIPGNSILLAALAMALGISLTPRRFAGSVMGAGALGTAWLLNSRAAATYGTGSFVSLCLLGPMMDMALRGARSGGRVYTSLLFAGVASNLLALASRAAPKLLGLDAAGARAFDGWWMQAAITDTLSGIVAGLLGAFCWFQFNDRSVRPPLL